MKTKLLTRALLIVSLLSCNVSIFAKKTMDTDEAYERVYVDYNAKTIKAKLDSTLDKLVKDYKSPNKRTSGYISALAYTLEGMAENPETETTTGYSRKWLKELSAVTRKLAKVRFRYSDAVLDKNSDKIKEYDAIYKKWVKKYIKLHKSPVFVNKE